MLKLNSNNANSVKNGQYKPGHSILREFARPMVVMMSAVVGVGFVSGAEIWSFFARFGEFCWAGIFVFAILFFGLTLKIISKNAISEKRVKLYKINKNTLKYTFLTKTHTKKVLLFLSELFIASAMFSGLKELICQLFKDNHIMIFCFCVLLVFFLLYYGMSGIEKFNILTMIFILFVVIVMLIFGFKGQCVGGKNLMNTSRIAGEFKIVASFKNITFSVCLALAYVFMNIIQIQPIASAYNMPLSKRKCLIFSLIMTFLMTLLIVLYVLFLHNNIVYANASMPLLMFFKKLGNKWLLSVFVCVLFFGLLSTLFACLFGVKSFVAKSLDSNACQTFVSVMLSLVISVLDFEVFVGLVYPVLGVVSFIIFIFL